MGFIMSEGRFSWSPWGGVGRSPVDSRTASTPFPVDKGAKRGPERLRGHLRRFWRASQAPG